MLSHDASNFRLLRNYVTWKYELIVDVIVKKYTKTDKLKRKYGQLSSSDGSDSDSN